MCHVDSLSRNTCGAFVEPPPQNNDFLPNVMNIQADNWLLTLQLGDHELERIKNIISSKDSVKEIKSIQNFYTLKNNQLFRYVDDDHKELRWVVPKEARWQICKLNHDDISAGLS